jgi:lipoprotein NlpD
MAPDALHFVHVIKLRRAIMSRSCALVLLLLLGACSSRYAAPVNDLDETPRFIDSGRQHRVNGGETLYVVAWMYDLDVNALARANNISEPYAIAPGQMLLVDLRSQPQSAVRSPPTTATATPAAVATGIQRTPLESAPITRQPLPSSTPAGQDNPAASTPAPVAARSATGNTTAPPAPPVNANAPIRWDWPARGNLIGRFSDSGTDTKGIKIGGSEGDPVLAAADGEVVYTGNGLLRYGELVILKHSDRFLSAYAHNKTIRVREGERVTRGQQIAELGSTGIDRNMLHFEVRLDGKPVDPLQYLPAR